MKSEMQTKGPLVVYIVIFLNQIIIFLNFGLKLLKNIWKFLRLFLNIMEITIHLFHEYKNMYTRHD